MHQSHSIHMIHIKLGDNSVLSPFDYIRTKMILRTFYRVILISLGNIIIAIITTLIWSISRNSLTKLSGKPTVQNTGQKPWFTIFFTFLQTSVNLNMKEDLIPSVLQQMCVHYVTNGSAEQIRLLITRCNGYLQVIALLGSQSFTFIQLTAELFNYVKQKMSLVTVVNFFWCNEISYLYSNTACRQENKQHMDASYFISVGFILSASFTTQWCFKCRPLQ